MKKKIKAVIIAGGLGTRLRPLTYNTPKPIIPVANRPFTFYQIELLKRHGINEVILNLHYLSDRIKKVFEKEEKELGIKMQYSLEEKPLGTCGAVKNAEKYFDCDLLIIFNGDTLTDINLTEVIDFHITKKATATLVLTRVADPTPYGLVFTDKEGRVERFLEKPSWERVTTNTINAGIYVIDPKIFKQVPVGKEYSFERQLYPDMLNAGDPIFGYISESYWLDVGSPQRYMQAHHAILRGEVAVKILGTREKGNIWVGEGSRMHASTQMFGPILIGNNCRSGEGVTLKEFSVLGDEVVIGRNSIVKNSILLSGTRIGENVNLEGCITGFNCAIEDDVALSQGVVLADGCVIKKGSRFYA